MNKKIFGIVLAVIVLIGGAYYALAGSGSTANGTGTIEITHKLSKTPIKVTANPKKTVVFDYGTLDILDGLNVEVAGVAKSSLPSYLNKFEDDAYTDVGTLFEPNFETIAKMQPDVIFISGRQSAVYDELAKIAPTLYYEINPSDYMGSFTSNVNEIASIYGQEKVAEKAIKSIYSKIETVQTKVAALEDASTLITLTNDGEISAYGANSRFGLIHNTLNFAEVDKSIETTNHGQQVSYEYIVEKNPSFIFVIDRNKAIGEGQSGQDVFNNVLMKDVQASKDGHIVFLNQEMWYLASGGLTSTDAMITEIDAILV